MDTSTHWGVPDVVICQTSFTNFHANNHNSISYIKILVTLIKSQRPNFDTIFTLKFFEHIKWFQTRVSFSKYTYLLKSTMKFYEIMISTTCWNTTHHHVWYIYSTISCTLHFTMLKSSCMILNNLDVHSPFQQNTEF